VGDSFSTAVDLPILVGLSAALLLEWPLQPRTLPVWKRHPANHCIHAGLWLLLFSIELALFRRPWLATANALAVIFVLVLVNNAKFQSLREPFVFQDFDYCVDMLKHPRLYIPFLGVHRAILAVGSIGVALYIGVKIEPPLTARVLPASFLTGLVVILASGIFLIALGTRKSIPLTLDPQFDLQQRGLLSSLWLYAVAEISLAEVPTVFGALKHPSVDSAALPNLVVVQSESFFDVRRLFSGVRQEVLRQYDEIRMSAACHGQVEVPAWGANTVRTEFAFLSGLAPNELGIHRFNPYRKLVRREFPTLAWFLKSIGYRTVCVHPYPATFYGRDKVYPFLGFDQFIDIASFNRGQNSGPYVDDVALAEKVCAVLGEAVTTPVFVFVITMENHGPLHLEKAGPGEIEQFYSAAPPDGCDDLTVYLRHLRNADRMAGILCETIEALPRPGWLCWYGDHVPIMTRVYDKIGVPDGKTDFLIWQKGSKSNTEQALNLKIENLAMLLLQKMALADLLAPQQRSAGVLN
jgi:hypothetical protein